MKLRIVSKQEMWLLENEPSATVLKEKEWRSRPGDGHADHADHAEQLRVDQTARDWWQTSVPAKCHHAWNTHLIRATCYNNSDGQHLKLLTRQMSPIYSLWDQGTPPFFFRADILEESLSFTQTDGLCSHVQCIKKVKFAKPWWTATVFGYRSTRFNTLQQEQLLKHQFHLWVQEGCRRQCISIYLHMVRDLFSRAHWRETRKFWETWFSTRFPTLTGNTSWPCTTAWFARTSFTLNQLWLISLLQHKNQSVQNISPSALVPKLQPAIKKSYLEKKSRKQYTSMCCAPFQVAHEESFRR